MMRKDLLLEYDPSWDPWTAVDPYEKTFPDIPLGPSGSRVRAKEPSSSIAKLQIMRFHRTEKKERADQQAKREYCNSPNA